MTTHTMVESDDAENEHSDGHDDDDGPGGPFDDESDVDVASTSDVEHSDEDDNDSDEVDGIGRKPSFRLREILFYDDKISIFRARHGRL